MDSVDEASKKRSFIIAVLIVLTLIGFDKVKKRQEANVYLPDISKLTYTSKDVGVGSDATGEIMDYKKFLEMERAELERSINEEKERFVKHIEEKKADFLEKSEVKQANFSRYLDAQKKNIEQVKNAKKKSKAFEQLASIKTGFNAEQDALKARFEADLKREIEEFSKEQEDSIKELEDLGDAPAPADLTPITLEITE